jgi:hypothetical protein
MRRSHAGNAATYDGNTASIGKSLERHGRFLIVSHLYGTQKRMDQFSKTGQVFVAIIDVCRKAHFLGIRT